MSILDIIDDHDKWLEFYNYKMEKGHLTKAEQKEWKEFINNKKYVSIAVAIKDGTYTFSIPKKKLVNKIGTDKKRVVYCYSKEENYILKFNLDKIIDCKVNTEYGSISYKTKLKKYLKLPNTFVINYELLMDKESVGSYVIKISYEEVENND